MCECDKMLQEIVRTPVRTQRGDRKCFFGGFASPLMKLQACPASRFPLRLHPLQDVANQTRAFQESARGVASFLGWESRAPG